MSTKSNIILPIIKGLLFIVLGVLSIIEPLETLEILTIYFGIAVGFRGCYLLYMSLSGKSKQNHKSWIIVNGLMDIVFGFILIIHPAVTLELLPFMIGFWAIMSGLLESAIATTQNLKQSWPKFLFGCAVMIFGWVILLHPLYTSILFSNLFGGFLIFVGLGYILLTITIRKLFSN